MEKTAPLWRFTFFGGFLAHCAEREIDRLQTRRTEALLAYLALHPGLHERETLVELLWPDAPLDAGRNRLTQAVVWLRPVLEPAGVERGGVLAADRHRVGLQPGSAITDVTEFEALLRQATTTGTAEGDATARSLRAAVDLYHGTLLPRLDDEWIETIRQRLLERYLGALRRLIAHEEKTGDGESAIAYARRALTADPLSEEAYLDLIRLLAANGETGAARRQYREMERVLAEALAMAPSPAARDLWGRLQSRGAPAVSVPVEKEATTVPAPPLPAPLTRFFGRTDDIRRLKELLSARDVRLLTLVGVGGAGKTRLAIETARQVQEAFPGGVWFLPLADLGDARQIATALGELLQLPRAAATTAPLELAVVALATRNAPVLLVLDNLEHLLADVSALVRTLLQGVPNLIVLATSRQRLGLEGEHEWPVLPLALPHDPELATADGDAVDSVGLFVDRARAVRPGFALTAQNAPIVARLCERLDGLPLAIELCAAWAQTLTPAQMLTQLTHRFDLLVSRRSDIPARHRSLRAALENSYLLLPPDVQLFFVRLSVFRGGWTLEAAAAICFDTEAPTALLTALLRITELRERSLVVAEEEDARADADPAMRYRMLETLREFAEQQRTLAVEAQLRRRHADYFVALAEAAELELQGEAQVHWLARLEAELDNLRAALAWCAESLEAALGLRLASALVAFWDLRGYLAEGQDWLERFLHLSVAVTGGESTWEPLAHSTLAKARLAQGQLARSRADFATAESAATEALRLATDRGYRRTMTQALLMLASVAYTRQDYTGARATQEQALGLAREINDPLLIASALLGLGNVAMEEAEWDRAWALYGESLALYRTLDNRARVGATLNNMGLIARYRGDLVQARALFEEDLGLGRTLANRSGIAVTLLNLGTVLRLQGEWDAARDALREGTALAQHVGNRRALAWCIKEFGHLCCARGDLVEGVRLLSASETLRQQLGMSFKPADPESLETDTARARTALGGAAFAAAWTAGTTLSAADACAAIRGEPTGQKSP